MREEEINDVHENSRVHSSAYYMLHFASRARLSVPPIQIAETEEKGEREQVAGLQPLLLPPSSVYSHYSFPSLVFPSGHFSIKQLALPIHKKETHMYTGPVVDTCFTFSVFLPQISASQKAHTICSYNQ